MRGATGGRVAWLDEGPARPEAPTTTAGLRPARPDPANECAPRTSGAAPPFQRRSSYTRSELLNRIRRGHGLS
jgi:hypothetical protein